MPSKIEWTEETWSPVTGCSPVSEGCVNCFAASIAKRFWKDRKFSEVKCHPGRLSQPMKWKKPRKIFVCSMSDLFHPEVPFSFIREIWNITAKCPQHTFMLLTKRPERMLKFTKWMAGWDHISIAEWPRNCWLGVTAENQEQADKRIPILLEIPAAVRFVSVEPMLGAVDLRSLKSLELPGCLTHDALLGRNIHHDDDMNWTDGERLDWVICGGESGPKARPMHPDWARSLRDQCVSAGVSYFLKQMHIDGKLVKMPELDGREWNETPA